MRLSVQKTLKMYMGGKFIRSESGRVLPTTAADGTPMNACRASRKDLRNALENNRKSQLGWAGRTGYNRGQILYRLAEMLEGRTLPTTSADLHAATDRLVHHAGWCDKITALLSTLNPTATAYVNYSMVRSLGIVVAFPDPQDGLLGIVEATCAITVMGNAGTIIVPIEMAELATAYTEALATCDLPGGVINVLTGHASELAPVADIHDDLDAIYFAGDALSEELRTASELAGAGVMRRIVHVPRATKPAHPDELVRLAELKTVWMSAQGSIPEGRQAY